MNPHIDQYLEQHLGPIVRGWSPVGEPSGVQVCLFADQPISGAVTYSTLGLSQYVLAMPKGREVRQELLFATHARSADDDFSKLLLHVAESVVKERRALLRGEIVSLGHAVSRGSLCRNMYVSLPVIFPEGFGSYDEIRPTTVFAWMLPITDAEAEMIKSCGWSEFENILEKRDADLFELSRPSLV